MISLELFRGGLVLLGFASKVTQMVDERSQFSSLTVLTLLVQGALCLWLSSLVLNEATGLLAGDPSPYERTTASLALAAGILYLVLWLGSYSFAVTIARNKGRSPFQFIWATVLTLLGIVDLWAAREMFVIGMSLMFLFAGILSFAYLYSISPEHWLSSRPYPVPGEA